ncbi:TATA box-binding protein-associated factor RNA polymerase I subunit D [Hyla sarda]|uniref:TATA box-binding protein-associated factor RNA polymerase I subunit D n=1 Tax=Hyla sarda TaxID=327740 RepID=UPI0024C3AB7C|nr:TATA box-binding protein-associated factor RNA polymerase I subunit D [Hyla sarda]XP_056412434.1 TATA box-binding protein-associated factor RNA polymerase I subunit D [Hyla sarda]XP_056412435.1 TATA box-binding protein-associated factor RNA polymerase I subunit D [Hyla sarda]XP_056412436.1 TATA box-binding protein-associated factor RNA polymerase I subunit D [Hyla sarda]
MWSSETPRMDHPNLECELAISSAEGNEEYPDGQELITDSEHRPESGNFPTTNETCSSDDSLFQDPRTYSPTRTRRIRSDKEQTSSFMNITSDDSSDYLPMGQKIADYLKKPSRKWRKIKKKRKRVKKYFTTSKGSLKGFTKRKFYSISSEERRRRLIDQGIQFHFTPLKHLPFKLYFEYEQFVLGGFLNHIKNLKYERSLKESLKDMKMDEDLENENFQMRKYSYLDEDGPLSPISEPGENLNEDEAEEEVEVVETSAFILDRQVPSKEDWQIKKKKKKKK